MKKHTEAQKRKQNELLNKCEICTGYNSPTAECCDNCCCVGKELRQLEEQYSSNESKGNAKKEV